MVQTQVSNRKRKLSAQQHEASTSTKLRRNKACQDGILYFNWLPNDVMISIIRFTSERPRHTIWQGNVTPEIALGLVESDAVLSRSAFELFRSLAACEACVACSPEPSISLQVFGLWNCSRRVFCSLLSKLRQTLTEVRIEPNVFPEIWTQSLSLKFPQLKRLSFYAIKGSRKLPLFEILAAQGEGLESLKLSYAYFPQDEVDAIAEYCKGLKLFFLEVEQTKADIGKICNSIGSSLEEVSLRNPSERVNFDIPSMRTSCKKIVNFSVFYIGGEFQPERYDELEALCQSLGDQLKSLTLEYCSISPVRLGRIATACKNLAIDLTEISGCTSAALAALGPRANRVDVVPDKNEEFCNESANIALAGTRCTNLAGITMSGSLSEAGLRAFFADPKPMLTEFEGQNYNLSNGGYVFEVLASRVSSLQTFTYSGTMSAAPVLLQFIEANPLLETVSLAVLRSSCCCIRIATLYTSMQTTTTQNWVHALICVRQLRYF